MDLREFIQNEIKSAISEDAELDQAFNRAEPVDEGWVDWKDAQEGDSALVTKENKLGLIVRAYGRKFHLKFVDGTMKTYDAKDLKFMKDESITEGKVKVFMRKILGNMVDNGLGVHTPPKMRDEMKKEIEDSVRKIMQKYDYIVEGKESLDEKLITFSNRAPYGQVVFMAGGAGSGKGFAVSNFIDAAGFKVRDVDEMKKAVGELDKIGKFSVDAWYKKYADKLSEKDRAHIEEFVLGKGMSIADVASDLKNPNNVMSLHLIVDAMGLKDKWLINMLKGKENKETLPNLLFDITAKKVGSITSVIKPLIDAGYDANNIHLIWVLTNYHLAVAQNKSRARVVPDDILLLTHEGAAKTIWGLLSSGLPKGLNGRVDVILNNRENTVMFKDSKGNEMKGAVKGFKSLPVKKQGGGILPEKLWKKMLYGWINDNGPKTINLQRPLDTQIKEAKLAESKQPINEIDFSIWDAITAGAGFEIGRYIVSTAFAFFVLAMSGASLGAAVFLSKIRNTIRDRKSKKGAKEAQDFIVNTPEFKELKKLLAKTGKADRDRYKSGRPVDGGDESAWKELTKKFNQINNQKKKLGIDLYKKAVDSGLSKYALEYLEDNVSYMQIAGDMYRRRKAKGEL